MTLIPRYRLLLALAALSFLPALSFYYVGEEAIFPISSLEMWQRGEWFRQYLYGMDLQHNPLFNWLIMPISALAGWEHVLIITRVLTIGATLATGLVLAWLCGHLYQDRQFAAFAALAYVCMADVLFYRGWLGYVDPLFALFVFASISTLWVAARERRMSLLAVSGLALTCAFLSKAFTAYVFYGSALFVLMFEAGQRAFLLRRSALLVFAATLMAPVLWIAALPGGDAQGGRMIAEIFHKLSFTGMADYFIRLLAYPAENLLRMAPITLLALYYGVRNRRGLAAMEARPVFNTACWIALLSVLPYWLSPQGGSRYLLPVYPVLALVAARLVWHCGETARDMTRKWVVAALVLKFVLVLAVFPYYQNQYRGRNYSEAAADIEMRVRGYPLYVTDVSAPGLSVSAYMDQRRAPAPALQWPPAQWESGFVLAVQPDAAMGSVVTRYALGGDDLYLLCRGAACGK